MLCFFFQAEDGIRDLVRSRGLGDVYKRQEDSGADSCSVTAITRLLSVVTSLMMTSRHFPQGLSLIHI